MNAGRKAEPEMSVDRAGIPINRRSFLGVAAAAAGATAVSPLLAGCGTTAGNTGTTSASQLAKILPAYVPTTAIKPDISSVNGSDPAYLTYPTNLVHTISETPGAGGSYTTITPLWGAIPAAGNPYYGAVNKALGANLAIQPANGNTYANALPPLFSGNKLPDWINIPSWNTQPLNFGQAVAAKFADLTPYLSGDNVKKYPNLANIPPGAWQAGIWNNKIRGLPVFPSNVVFTGAIFYRQDILHKLGITPDVKSAADLFALGKEVNDPKGKRWAFDDPFTYLYQPFNIPNNPPYWTTNSKGDLVASAETEQYIEALNWLRSVVAAGMMHPGAIALDTSNAKQRFYSGQVVITGDGTGAWNGSDTLLGKAAQPNYVRTAFPLFTASGTGTPRIALGNGAGLFSYLSKGLTKSQIEECLRIANYLAAPYGSYEYTLVNFGVQGRDWTPSAHGPIYTTQGTKEANEATFQFLATGPSVTSVQNGFTSVARDYALWQQSAAKYKYKPLFYDMNISVPSNLNSALASFTTGPLYDMTNNVVRGRNTIADFQSTVKAWQRNGGNGLRTFFEGIRAKYGDA
jgi:putative aldouronate transport system substrate-binding protein